MARKKVLTIEYTKNSRLHSVLLRFADREILNELAGLIRHAKSRGIQVVNATDPLAGVDAKPRKVRAGKPELPDVPGPGRVTGGGDSAVSRALKMREGS